MPISAVDIAGSNARDAQEKAAKLDKEVGFLDQRVADLEKCVELLISDCRCSVKERMSGHLTDCPVPHIKEILCGDGI